MLNINFLKKTAAIKKKALNGEISLDELSNCYEKTVAQKPVVFQLETTNVCNVRCEMCPRTSKMQRRLGHMEPETTGFRGPLMVQSLTSAKSKFLSLGVGITLIGKVI